MADTSTWEDQPPPYTPFASNDRANNSTTHFQYQGLIHDDGIRLLKLHARRGDGIECSLEHHRLGSRHCPPYRALSYTWDNGDARFDLRMPRNSVLKVRKTLWDALDSLRDAVSDCWIWCDAVCINQNSEVERNYQVRLIGDIYKNANIVVAWLRSAGEDSVDVGRARTLIRSFLHEDNNEQRGQRSARDWIALIAVCNLRYWTRKWVGRRPSYYVSMHVWRRC